MKRLPRWMWGFAAFFVALLALLVLLLASAWWYSGSEAALSRALAAVIQQSGGKLEIEGTSGSLRDRMTIARLRWHDGDLTVIAEQIELHWSPRALLTRQLQIEELTAQHVSVTTTPSKEPLTVPTALALPLAVHVDQIKIARLDIATAVSTAVSSAVSTAGAVSTPLQFSNLQLSYSGDANHHQLHQAGVTTPYGAMQAELDLQARRPFVLVGDIHYSDPADGLTTQALTAQIKLNGNLTNVDVQINAHAGTAQLDGKASLKPFEPAWLSALQLNSSDVDLASLNRAWPKTRLGIAVNANTASTPRAGQLGGSINASNALPGTLGEQRIPLRHLQSAFQLKGDQLQFSDLQLMLGLQGSANGSGVLDIATLQSHWQLALREIDLRSFYQPLRATRLAGTIKASIAEGTNEIQADLREQNMSVLLDLTQQGDEIELRQLQAQAGAGRLSGQGRLSLKDRQAFSFKLNSTHLDPAAFGAFPSASINAEAIANGFLAPQWSANLRFIIDDGSQINKLPLAGDGRLQVNGQQVRNAALQLRLGDNRLQAQGNWGRASDVLEFKLDAPRLVQIDTAFGLKIDGVLNASGTVSGTTAAPVVRAKLHGSSLRYRNEYRVSEVAGEVELGNDVKQNMQVQLQVTGLVSPQVQLAQTALRMDGTLAQHDISLSSSNPAHPRLDLKARLRGGLQGGLKGDPSGGWRGQLLTFEQQGDLVVRLLAPVALELDLAHVQVGAADLTIAPGGAPTSSVDGRIHLSALQWEPQRLNTSGTFSAIPAAPLLSLAGMNADVQSSLILGGQWALNTTPRLNGTLTLTRESGDLALVPGNSNAASSFGLNLLELQARWIDDALDARLNASAMRIGKLSAQLSTQQLSTPLASAFALDVPARLTAQLDVISLRPLAALSGTSAVVDGKLRLNLNGNGPLNALKLSGTVEGDGLTLEAPQYGLLLKDGRLRAQLLDDQLQLQEFLVSGGDGKLSMSGAMSLRSVFNQSTDDDVTSTLTWKAERFRALQRPDAKLVLDGNGTLAWVGEHKQSHIDFKGKVRAIEAHFELPDTTSVRLGDDVVVKGRTRNAAAAVARAVPLQLDLEADLGPRFTIAGRGIDVRLEGQIKVRSTANGNLQAYGRIATANGIYQAFGQKLNIEHGLIYFDGPIDNPGLDLLAYRKNLPVEAGVQISGTVQVPQVQLVSEPPVSDGEKLSWLILGKGLDGATSADTGTLQAAASLLYGATVGTAGGPSLAKKLGLDDVGLQQRAGGGEGQVVSFGKRLSDRLYLAYEQGLSVAANALRIEYVLTRYITLRVEAGQVNSFGIYFNRSYP